MRNKEAVIGGSFEAHAFAAKENLPLYAPPQHSPEYFEFFDVDRSVLTEHYGENQCVAMKTKGGREYHGIQKIIPWKMLSFLLSMSGLKPTHTERIYIEDGETLCVKSKNMPKQQECFETFHIFNPSQVSGVEDGIKDIKNECYQVLDWHRAYGLDIDRHKEKFDNGHFPSEVYYFDHSRTDSVRGVLSVSYLSEEELESADYTRHINEIILKRNIDFRRFESEKREIKEYNEYVTEDTENFTFHDKTDIQSVEMFSPQIKKLYYLFQSDKRFYNGQVIR